MERIKKGADATAAQQGCWAAQVLAYFCNPFFILKTILYTICVFDFANIKHINFISKSFLNDSK
jgi:hypothetical protein